MIPWHKLPMDVQRFLLALTIAAGGTTVAGCCLPRVCDPAPPPSVSPKPTLTPTWPRVCDPPPPPPRTMTPSPTVTPTMTVTPTHTVTPGARPTSTPTKLPVICDPPPPPPAPPASPSSGTSSVGQANQAAAAQRTLPLAEIRSVDICWQGGLTFAAQTEWPEARYHWSASGGLLEQAGETVTWHPPEEPGHYLLQVAADWGTDGLAVDALVLVVAQDGGVAFG